MLIHGALVAMMQGNGLWPMFALGFAGLIVVTQMHGLGLSRRWKWAILGAYVLASALVYNWCGWHRLDEVLRIPVIEYVSVFVLAGIFWLGMRLFLLARSIRGTPVVAPARQ